MKFNVILFDCFETIDAFGPVEVVGTINKFMEKKYEIEFYSLSGGMITSSQNVKVHTQPISSIEEAGIILIPGGFGTRNEVNNQKFIQNIKALSEKAQYVLTVCTGSALLAKTGLIKGLKATTNKMAFDWVVEQDKDVNWIRKARWVVNGKYYTSSGVSAGMDMTLGFVSDTLGKEVAERVTKGIEYLWNSDKENDPFC
ncbi:MAG: DJ-1/PfpI family protein [Clostridia bacterium]|nr:DJ-1/PfpI family protein [Clostridia bacterium]